MAQPDWAKEHVQRYRKSGGATAATADGASRARLWNVMTAIYPPYDEYREKAAATREIPVVVLRRD